MVGCLLTATLMMAQKKEIAEAETYLKSGKNLDKAEKLMKDLLKKESNQGRIEAPDAIAIADGSQINQVYQRVYLVQLFALQHPSDKGF